MEMVRKITDRILCKAVCLAVEPTGGWRNLISVPVFSIHPLANGVSRKLEKYRFRFTLRSVILPGPHAPVLPLPGGHLPTAAHPYSHKFP